MIKAIFFDVGNTLIRTALPTADACRYMLHKHGHTVSHADVEAAMQAADVEHLARYHTPNEDWAHPATIMALWLRYYRTVFDQLGLVDEDELLAQSMIAWYGQPEAWQPFPEVLTVLAAMQRRGLLVGAVSDWAPTLTSILHGHGLTQYLDFVLGSGTIGFCKPSPAFYRLALQRAQVHGDQALHVGDSYYADVRGARAAGIRPVLVDRARHAPPLDCAVVHNLLELDPLVDALI